MVAAKSQFTVGRNHDCDIPIADDSVSRVHAEIMVEAERLRVTDRQSRNGTRLIRNRKITQIQREYVLTTDELQFGEVTLAVSDILAAIRHKYPQSLLSQPAPALAGEGEKPAVAKPAVAKPAGSKPPGSKMMRCSCGFIRPQDQPCPECSA